MVKAGGARAIRAGAFTPVELAKQIQKMALLPDTSGKCGKGSAEAVGGPMRFAIWPIWSNPLDVRP